MLECGPAPAPQDLCSHQESLSMVAAPSDGFHGSQWRSTCLLPTEEQKRDVGHPGRATLDESLGDRSPWEEELLGQIRAMSDSQRSRVLEAIQHRIEEHTQVITIPGGSSGLGLQLPRAGHWGPSTVFCLQLLWKEVADPGIRELLAPLNLEPQQPVEKAFLFLVYGLILRECASSDLVRRHLMRLLELSHQTAGQREGMAVASGIASSSHLQEVWATLEHLGRTRVLRTACTSPDYQEPYTDVHWRWVSSTSLLCYGHMALHAGERILPWVDNVISRMVYYFSCSCYDNILETSFLSAAVMLVKALKQEHSTRRYRFTQIPELIQCLLAILQKEPNFLATLFRQKIILVIMELSKLQPSLKPVVKSRILQTCLQSLYMLPPMEMLKSCLPPLDLAPDVMVLYQKSMQALDLLLQTFISENKSMDEMCFLLQHTEPWLKSDKSHECKRVVQTIFLLLKYVVDYVKLTDEATPSMLGHQIGLLMLLWRDRDPVTQSHSRQCIYLLLQLLIQQKGSMGQFMHLNKMKNFEAKALRRSEMKFYNLVKALDRSLTPAQHTQLILTLLGGLCSHDHLQCDLASQLLLMIFQNQSIKVEQVAEILQGLFQELPSIVFKNILQTMMKAVTVLGTQHTQETVEVMLSLCHPSERQVLPLWKALANNNQLARKVLMLLYMKLKLRPPKELVRLSQQAELISLLALGTIYELLYTREYKATVRWAFAGILVGLLTQLHYLFELDVVEGISDYQEDSLEVKPLSPCRTCLEALKGLFWTTNYWEVFAYLQLLRGWELFEHLETYTEGVTLLARAMAHYDCEVKAVLGQAVISLKSSEERDNIVAILVITEPRAHTVHVPESHGQLPEPGPEQPQPAGARHEPEGPHQHPDGPQEGAGPSARRSHLPVRGRGAQRRQEVPAGAEEAGLPGAGAPALPPGGLLPRGGHEDEADLPALCHPAQVGVPQGAVREVGVGPWPRCRERHFHLHGGEQLRQLPPVSHAGVDLPGQPPQKPEADGHEVHRGHPAGLLYRPLLFPEEGRPENLQEILGGPEEGLRLREPQILPELSGRHH
ncbi:maestro heat-like repeat family member 5 isoform X17 [Canis lupus familiaris]|uniref:maestro heat-like repeat family member 5 isoform X17 n=1 Tax=Canis lupus familiaris TaxID=9615 RepID=UPI000BA9FC22|nr:maestro heat-like repeat family member 5 isoform X17 [Canis lupus familiaris]XP_038411610.1 maestro heat-like repeat family member 5 isoform X17 [Canis lupus familiaris]|eukprot:XP_022282520.1 maestro heat-like repeat family member 5 isoform X16 [Canis lupus familiaris]